RGQAPLTATPQVAMHSHIASPIDQVHDVHGRLGHTTDAPADKELRQLIAQSEVYRSKRPMKSLRARQTSSINIMQHEAAITRAHKNLERFLQTFGAAPCFIVTIYDPISKTAALSHIDAGMPIGPSITQIVEKMGIPAGRTLESRIIGGYHNARSYAESSAII